MSSLNKFYFFSNKKKNVFLFFKKPRTKSSYQTFCGSLFKKNSKPSQKLKKIGPYWFLYKIPKILNKQLNSCREEDSHLWSTFKEIRTGRENDLYLVDNSISHPTSRPSAPIVSTIAILEDLQKFNIWSPWPISLHI